MRDFLQNAQYASRAIEMPPRSLKSKDIALEDSLRATGFYGRGPT